MNRNESTHYGALVTALIHSQSRYMAALMLCCAYVAQSGDAELIAACGGLLAK